jgi:hypothetical protein
LHSAGLWAIIMVRNGHGTPFLEFCHFIYAYAYRIYTVYCIYTVYEQYTTFKYTVSHILTPAFTNHMVAMSTWQDQNHLAWGADCKTHKRGAGRGIPTRRGEGGARRYHSKAHATCYITATYDKMKNLQDENNIHRVMKAMSTERKNPTHMGLSTTRWAA